MNALIRATPFYSQYDSIETYLNNEIKNLQKTKSKLLTELHKVKNRMPYDVKLLNKIEALIKIVKKN